MANLNQFIIHVKSIKHSKSAVSNVFLKRCVVGGSGKYISLEQVETYGGE